MTARVHVTAATAAAFGVSKPKRGHKYRAVACELDGVKFPSKRERDRYAQLKLLEQAGEIFELKRQVRFPLVVNGVKVGTYVADFTYLDGGNRIPTVEDEKGKVLPLFQLKAALFSVLYSEYRFLINGEPYKP